MRIAVGVVLLVAIAAAGDDPYAQVLRTYGIEPEAAVVRAYLKSLLPADEVRRYARKQIDDLASPDGPRRLRATRALFALGAGAPLDVLQEAARSDDPEVARRARTVLGEARSRRAGATYAALRFIATKPLCGLAPEVLRVIPLIDDAHTRAVARDALVATATPEDAGILRGSIRAGADDVRAAAVSAFASALGPPARDELHAFLKLDGDTVRLAAAWSLADLEDRRCIATFVQLLDSTDSNVRIGAVQALRRLAGTQFGYVPLADVVTRTRGVLAWGEWAAANAATATWRTPLKRSAPFLGRILVTMFNQQRVVEFDASGKKIWEKRGIKGGWACAGTPEGHRIVAQLTNRRIVEYDAAGKEVWEKTGLPGFPNSIQRLPNGNTLVACSFGVDRLLEFTADGKTVWDIKVGGYPTEAQRLPSGTTLVALYKQGKVVEIDRQGKVVWELDGLKSPYSAQRLDGGNTLICELGARRVIEMTPAGKVAWEYRSNAGCLSARRMPDGRTLIATGAGVFTVDRQGKVRWIVRGRGSLRATSY